MTDEAINSITNILATNHNISDPCKYDFLITSQEEISNMLTTTSKTMTILLAPVAAISLLDLILLKLSDMNKIY